MGSRLLFLGQPITGEVGVDFVEWWNVEKIEGRADIWGNTPPIHAIVAGAFSDIVGYRLVSIASWILVAALIRNRVGALLWLAFPLSYQWAGRISPDMFVTLGIFVIYRGLNSYLPIAILTKPVALFTLPSLILEKRYSATITALVGAVILSGIPGFLTAISGHVADRGFGFWELSNIIALIGGTGGLALAPQAWRRTWRWTTPLLAFYLYAAPTLHGYYALPMLPFFALGLAKGLNLNRTVWFWLLIVMWLTGLGLGLDSGILINPLSYT